MRRFGGTESFLELLANARALVPAAGARSNVIVGFPGETEAEFEQLLDFLEEAQLDRVGAFAYSPVEGATANGLPDPVPEEVKQERLARFMEVQAGISAARLEAKVGRVLRVLVDEVDGDLAIARSMADAPEIDGTVQIQDGADLRPGDFADVHIMGADEHDLFGLIDPDNDDRG
jgi:ribosomal protein S12 methylthiotransferase